MAMMSEKPSWKAATSRLLRLDEILAQTVDEGVRHLVGDDVVRQAREDFLPRQVRSGVLFVGAEVPEEQRQESGS